MDRNQFLEYLDIYGSDLERWPDGVRQDAIAACSSSSELMRLLEEEKLFEETLSVSAIEAPSPALEARIIASARPRAQERRTFLEYLSGLFSAIPIPTPRFALPLLLVIGIAAGYYFANYTTQEDEPVQFAGVLFYEEGIYE